MISSSITVDQLIERYDRFLLDASGVLVAGQAPVPGAASFLQRLHEHGKSYLIVTNGCASLPAKLAIRYSNTLGLDIAQDAILCSGELIAPYFRSQGLVGSAVAVLGTSDSAAFVEQAGGRVVDLDEDFDCLVAANQTDYPFVETVDRAISRAAHLLTKGRQIEFLLPNPDLLYPKGSIFGMTAGLVAKLIQEGVNGLLGEPLCSFTGLGKPHAPIFQEALARAPIPAASTVMVGDQLITDIAGARQVGMDAVLMGTGLTDLSRFDSDASPIRPTYILQSW